MTYKSRTTSDRKPRGDWLGVTLGWIWALGTLAAASGLTTIVGHDLTHRADGVAAVSWPEVH
ncbi:MULTISPECIES: hypothetical protein [Streptomyces]|uniref:Uncharacterized protein n=1 Tax=Streptomyces hiroshimensis TaxID=66424 RepID=A0ABQ2Y7Q7_9ACTN|nr:MULTISPECIES: hypothetical protein [Streptomyces]GGX72862.1 hypothetical protein GCM10010324_17870 [Streptomyces hiroshimensis]